MTTIALLTAFECSKSGGQDANVAVGNLVLSTLSEALQAGGVWKQSHQVAFKALDLVLKCLP